MDPQFLGGAQRLAWGEGRPSVRIDWKIVKSQTLWEYEVLIKKLQRVLAYPFVKEHYNHSMTEAQAYAKKLRSGYLQDRGEKTAFLDELIEGFQSLGTLRVGTYEDLIDQVATRESCLVFLERTDFGFPRMIQTLNYLLRWVLPFETPLREFVETDEPSEAETLRALKGQEIRSNLDSLEAGRTRKGRLRLSREARLPMPIVTELVHRTDISRLAFVRGKTVRHLCGGGFDTLEKIAAADLDRMEHAMDAYYRSLGKSAADFKSVIPLRWMVGGAKVLPRVVEV
jgi:hypothetical protein